MAALLAAGDLGVRFVLVASDSAAAPGLAHAQASGLATEAVERSAFASKAAFEAGLIAVLDRHQIDLICLAGFMRVLSAGFVDRYRDRILNIHPSLLPAFRGLDTHRRALQAGVKLAGCTVHVVRARVDDGPILIQAAVPVHDTDTEASLAARILAQEHVIYPLAVKRFAARLAGGAQAPASPAPVPGASPAVLIHPAPGADGPAGD